MGRLGKEQVFFLGALLVVGWFFYGLLADPYQKKTPISGTRVSDEEIAAAPLPESPDGPLGPEGWIREARLTFKEPRDWHPLPPVDLVRPPLREPSMVVPHPAPAVGLEHLGTYRVRFETAGQLPDQALAVGDADEELPAAAEPEESASEPELLTTAEEEHKRRYDWLLITGVKDPWFGFILNEDKYRLEERPDEPIQFQRVNVKTGSRSTGPVARERLREDGIHLANNAVNRIERLLLQIPESSWGPGSAASVLQVLRLVMAEGEEDPYGWRRAEEMLEKLIPVDSGRAETYEALADCRAAFYDYNGEIEAVLAGAEAGCHSAGLIERRARWLWHRVGALTRALDVLEAGTTAFPGDRGLRVMAGLGLLEAGRPDAASVHFEVAQGLSETVEERREVHRLVGEARLQRGDLAGAASEAEKILTVKADDPQGLQLMAGVRYATGELDDAGSLYRDLLEVATSPFARADGLVGLGLVLVRQGELAEAFGRLAGAPRVNPMAGAQSWAARAFLLARGGAEDSAIDACREAVAMDPDSIHGRYLLGRFLRRTDDLEGARGELRQALDLGGSFSDLFSELGFLALIDGRPSDSVRYFQESLAREDRAETRVFLGHAQVAAESLLEARKTFQGVQPPSPDSQLGLAYCLYREGESEEGQRILQQLPELFPSAREEARGYAETARASIVDQESKTQWEEFILWRQVGNGWSLDERFGVGPRITTGNFRLMGTQRPTANVENWTALQRDVPLQSIHEYEVEVAQNPGSQGLAGMALAHIVGGGSRSLEGTQRRAAIILALEPDGTVKYRSGATVEELAGAWKVLDKLTLGPEDSVRLGIRRVERESPFFQLFVDGMPAGDPLEMTRWRGSQRQTLAALFFAAADGGKVVDVSMKRARLVRYEE